MCIGSEEEEQQEDDGAVPPGVGAVRGAGFMLV